MVRQCSFIYLEQCECRLHTVWMELYSLHTQIRTLFAQNSQNLQKQCVYSIYGLSKDKLNYMQMQWKYTQIKGYFQRHSLQMQVGRSSLSYIQTLESPCVMTTPQYPLGRWQHLRAFNFTVTKAEKDVLPFECWKRTHELLIPDHADEGLTAWWLLAKSEQEILWVTHRAFNSLNSRSQWAQQSRHLKFFRCLQRIDPDPLYTVSWMLSYTGQMKDRNPVLFSLEDRTD